MSRVLFCFVSGFLVGEKFLFSPLNKGENGLKSLKMKKNSYFDNLRPKENKRLYLWYKIGPHLPLACFLGAPLDIFYLVTNARYWKDFWWLLSPVGMENPTFLSLTVYGSLEKRQSIHGRSGPVAGTSAHPAPVTVLSWCLGTFFYFREKKPMSHLAPQRWFPSKCTLKYLL